MFSSTDIYIKNACCCQICGENCSSTKSLSLHIHRCHKNISKEEYYIKFINSKTRICECGNKKKFRNLGEGYRKYCSVKCRSNYTPPTNYWQGKKQSKSHIELRVKNTNQKNKEVKRKNTCLAKYGVDNPSKNHIFSKKISKSNLGKKMKSRTVEHSKKIISSKIKNGTLKHSESTKEKIKNSVLRVYQSEEPPITTSESNYKHHKSGHFNNIYYRSSYELEFLKYCKENFIVCESAENKTFRVAYTFNCKNYFYYPDFYLPEYDCIIEVKPTSMLKYKKNPAKIKTAKNRYGKKFFIVTENELFNLQDFFTKLIDCMKTNREHF